ncbi:MAG: transcriptional regulator [Planctomycetota bacterium]|jgi:DNA-binding MarR family transcriptional regulator
MADAGRYSYAGLARVIHEKARLSILTALASHPDGLLFPDLKELCALTDGNLARHLQALKEAELIEIWKKSRATLCRMSEEGRAQFDAYLAELERVVRDASPQPGKGKDLSGWSIA